MASAVSSICLTVGRVLDDATDVGDGTTNHVSLPLRLHSVEASTIQRVTPPR
jgi:hypothetical protein